MHYLKKTITILGLVAAMGAVASQARITPVSCQSGKKCVPFLINNAREMPLTVVISAADRGDFSGFDTSYTIGANTLLDGLTWNYNELEAGQQEAYSLLTLRNEDYGTNCQYRFSIDKSGNTNVKKVSDTGGSCHLLSKGTPAIIVDMSS